jgi:hypothetical protein
VTGPDNVALERRQWFDHFPEGSIEFTVVTRVLALLLLASLIVFPAAQRPTVLTALAGVVWLDYVIVIWWVVQMACDMNDLFAGAPIPAHVARRRRMLEGLKIVLPSLALLALIAPWPMLLIPRAAARAATMQVLVPVLLLLFCGLAIVSVRAIRRLGLAKGFWSVLLLVPLVHWLAVHRVLHTLASRLAKPAVEHGQTISQPRTAGSGVLLILAIVCWASWIALLWTDQSGAALRAAQGLSVLLGALFAVTDVATMEGLQRQFVTVLRKL